MRTIAISLLVLVLASIATITAQQAGLMRPGRWQNTVQMQVPGMPTPMPPQVSTRCVTAEQLQRDPNSWLPSGPDGQACTISDQKIVQNKVTWKVACTGQMAMTGAGAITFMDDTYDGTMMASMSMGEITMKLSGKRLGDCMP
jgi:hypothetical protein